MASKLSIILLIATVILNGSQAATTPNIVCFVNTTRFYEGFHIQDFVKALPNCNYVILGYAELDEKTFQVRLDEPIKTPINYFKTISALKQQNPNVKKVYLSVGGGQDLKRVDKKQNKYLDILESREKVGRFVKSVNELITIHEFDGVDLAWQWPEIPAAPSGFLKKLKNLFFKPAVVDKDEKEHRKQFVYLMEELAKEMKNKDITLTVLPNVNYTAYYDVKKLSNSLAQIHLLPLDCYTPTRNPNDPWYTSPLKANEEDLLKCNIHDAVTYWSDSNLNNAKIYLGIPTYGRTWKVVAEKDKAKGYLNIVAEGPGKAGTRTHQPGLLAYDEICTLIDNDKQFIQQNSKDGGTYIQKIPAVDKGEGIQIGFDTIDYIKAKIDYAKKENLGGLALYDITLDDYTGKCDNRPYSILSKVRGFLL